MPTVTVVRKHRHIDQCAVAYVEVRPGRVTTRLLRQARVKAFGKESEVVIQHGQTCYSCTPRETRVIWPPTRKGAKHG